MDLWLAARGAFFPLSHSQALKISARHSGFGHSGYSRIWGISRAYRAYRGQEWPEPASVGFSARFQGFRTRLVRYNSPVWGCRVDGLFASGCRALQTEEPKMLRLWISDGPFQAVTDVCRCCQCKRSGFCPVQILQLSGQPSQYRTSVQHLLIRVAECLMNSRGPVTNTGPTESLASILP